MIDSKHSHQMWDLVLYWSNKLGDQLDADTQMMRLTGRKSLDLTDSLRFGSIGVKAGLHPNMHVSWRRSKVYFSWERDILWREQATLMPWKYWRKPKSFTSKNDQDAI